MIEKNTAAVVLAAGSGKRMNSRVKKQFLELEGKPLIYYALHAFEQSIIEKVVLVTSPGDEEYCRGIVEKYGLHKVVAITTGGKERYHSVYCGLEQLRECEYVLIHDGARPFVTPAMIERALEGAKQYKACVVGMPSKDTVKISDEDGYAADTPKRDLVWMVQTPQAFAFDLIKEAYERLLEMQDIQVTDDAMVVETVLNQKVKLIEGSYRNIKVTTPEDLDIAKIFCKKNEIN